MEETTTALGTIAEAFRNTVAAHPDRVAVRTKDDEVSLTWSELRDRAFDGASSRQRRLRQERRFLEHHFHGAPPGRQIDRLGRSREQHPRCSELCAQPQQAIEDWNRGLPATSRFECIGKSCQRDNVVAPVLEQPFVTLSGPPEVSCRGLLPGAAQ